MWLGPPLLRVGLEGFRGYLVGVSADRRGGPAGERGREMEEEGETGWLESYFKLFLNKVQGWIFCCLIPCMFPNMRVQKIWQNRFFVLHTCISNSIWTFEFLKEETQVYYPWLDILFIENAKQIKNMLMILLTTMTRWIREKLDILKESRKQMI